MKLFEELQWRGAIHQTTAPELERCLNREGDAAGTQTPLQTPLQTLASGAAPALTLYVGYDPTGPSLHIGHLATLMTLIRLQQSGHRVIALIGGGTAPIGDPSGKSSERNLQDLQTINENGARLQEQIQTLFTNAKVDNFLFRNNADWLSGLTLIDFLRDTGKHFSVNAMVQKDSVKLRFEREGDGISFTEFSYALLQARDFLELWQRDGCSLQCGGSDQWGNIVGGIDLIRRVTGGQAYGLTSPLILDSTGQKFGKTEKGAIFLSAKLTSVFSFYQFWINQPDAQLPNLVRRFTLLSPAEITALEPQIGNIGNQERTVQKTLAYWVTAFVHGAAEAERVSVDSETLFAKDAANLSVATRRELIESASFPLVSNRDLSDSPTLAEALVLLGLCESKSDARRQMAQKAIKIDGNLVLEDCPLVFSPNDYDGRIVKRGKRQIGLIYYKSQSQP